MTREPRQLSYPSTGSARPVRPVRTNTTLSILRRLRLAILVCLLLGPLANLKAADGSTYVPLDSWVYASIDRLAGLGVVSKYYAGIRPWTRIQCAQIAAEADENLSFGDSENAQAATILHALQEEFADEISSLDGVYPRQATVESIYTRETGISGTPLRDSYHFGQTLSNDFGRPYNTGFNDVSGFSARASGGRFFAYVRGEYQYSPSYAGLTPGQQAAIAQFDGTPTAPNSMPTPAVSHFDFLEAYAGVRLGNMELTFGKQSLWWGPGNMGGMLYSDNIDPAPMLRLDELEPFLLPSFLKYLGPIKVQAFIARLSGDHFPPHPYLHGEKISLKPTPNLEVGISRTTEAFGQGIPITFENFFATYFSVSDVCCSVNPQDFPGKRQGGLDFSYRLPYLRNWVTVYSDNFSADDVNPVVNPSRAMFNPGIYIAQIPKLNKLDLRFELANTRHHEEAYSSFFYRDAYQNNGFLIGNIAGRNGSEFDATSTYWFSATRRVQAGWTEHKVSSTIIPSGGSQASVHVQVNWMFRHQLELSAFAQHEWWAFPFLANGTQNDNVISIGLSYYPQRISTRRKQQDSN